MTDSMIPDKKEVNGPTPLRPTIFLAGTECPKERGELVHSTLVFASLASELMRCTHSVPLRPTFSSNYSSIYPYRKKRIAPPIIVNVVIPMMPMVLAKSPVGTGVVLGGLVGITTGLVGITGGGLVGCG